MTEVVAEGPQGRAGRFPPIRSTLSSLVRRAVDENLARLGRSSAEAAGGHGRWGEEFFEKADRKVQLLRSRVSKEGAARPACVRAETFQ
jgi:hypothetical protein